MFISDVLSILNQYTKHINGSLEFEGLFNSVNTSII